MKILDEDGAELPQGTVGEIFFRPFQEDPTYFYIGSPPTKSTADGFHSVGDMGWIDEEGYLHLADRRVDLIITGGANVYPAEVEGAITEHPDVADAAVVGVPDDEWGQRVHAVVQPKALASPPEIEDLDAFCRERISSYKLPKTYEFLDSLPRDGAGKLRRRSLAEERSQADWPGMIAARRRG